MSLTQSRKPIFRAQLAVTELEPRLTPVVWNGAIGTGPPSLIPGDGNFEAYAGVVQLNAVGARGSGSLIQSADNTGYGSYILTSAHIFAGYPETTVGFDLPSRNTPGIAQQRISLTVPAGADYQRKYTSYLTTPNPNYDLEVLKLVDQNPATQSPTRLLVPPKGATAFKPYTVGGFTSTEINQPVTFVGYGRVSDGTTPIVRDAPLQWQGAPADAGRKSIGYNRVELATWDNGPGLFTSWDAFGAYKLTRVLLFDFDDGTAAHDAFGMFEGKPQTGVDNERSAAFGDSGGPWFETIDGQQYLVGVTSAVSRYPNPNAAQRLLGINQTDIDASTGSTVGEVEIASRVGSNYADFVQPQTMTGDYDLVLDMRYQMFGVTPSAAGGADNLTITARNVNGNLELSANNPDEPGSPYNGVYYSVPAANIKSLTIRGTNDNETIRIEGPLGLKKVNNIEGSVFIESGGGKDTIQLVGLEGSNSGAFLGSVFVDGGPGADDSILIDNSSSVYGYNQYTLGQGAPNYDATLARGSEMPNNGGFVLRPTINIRNVEQYTLVTGNGADVVAVNKTVTPVLGTLVQTRGGNDSVTIGSAAEGLANIRGTVFVDTGDGADELTFDDAMSNVGNLHYTLDQSGLAPDWSYALHRASGANALPSFHYTNADSIALKTSSQGDVVSVYAVPDVLFGTSVQTGNGDDDIRIGSPATGLSQVLGKVFIDAGADNLGTVRFVDSASTTGGNQYTLRPAVETGYDYRLSRFWSGALRPNIDSKRANRYELYTGTQADTISVLSAPAAASNGVVVLAGPGDDAITVGGPQGLDGISATVTVNGQTGTNTLIVDNRGSATENLTHKKLTDTKAAVIRSDNKTVEFENVKPVEVRTNGGPAHVDPQDKPAWVTLKVSYFGTGGNTAAFGAGVFGFALGDTPGAIVVPAAGTDQVTLAGRLQLELPVGFAPAVGAVFTVLDNQTALPLVGTFDDLAEGDEIEVGGWRFAISYEGQEGENDPDSNNITLTVVSESENTGSISGVVWDDLDADGLNDDTAFAAGVTVRLTDTATGHVLSTLTDEDGAYTFEALAAGTYVVAFDQSTSPTYGLYRFTLPSGDSDASPGTGATAPLTLEDGDELTDIDAGLIHNAPPAGADDWYAVEHETALVVSEEAEGVLGNDTDAESDALTAVVEDEPEHGTLVLEDDGTFTYTPDPDFIGTDTFSYYPVDRFGRGALTYVTIEVTNSRPEAEDGWWEGHIGDTAEGTVAFSDLDAHDADSLTVAVTTQGAHGTGTIDDERNWTYTPDDPEFQGEDSFEYTVTDPHGAETVATIHVSFTNAAPEAGDDWWAGHAGEDASGTVTFSDPDAHDADDLTVEVTTQGTHGTATVGADGAWSYTPNDPEFVGTDSFTYTVTDPHGATNTGTVTVEYGNADPVAGDDGWTGHVGDVAEGTVNFGDPDEHDADDLTVEVTTQGAHGTATVNTDGTWSYTPTDPEFEGTDTFEYTVTDPHGATATGAITVVYTNAAPTAGDDSWDGHVGDAAEGTVAFSDPDEHDTELTASVTVQGAHGTGAVNSDGTWSYTPNDPAFEGTDTFTYEVSDPHGATATGTVTVTYTNAAPDAGDDDASVNEDGTVTVSVLDNDSDPDGDAVTLDSVGSAAHGAAEIDDNGTPGDRTDDRIVYTPVANWSGTDTFTYQVSDEYGATASATVTVTVNPVNDAPTADADSVSTDEDTYVDVDLLELVSDVETPPEAITFAVSGATHGTVALLSDGHTARFTPSANFNGSGAGFTFTVTDTGDGTSAPITSSPTAVTVSVNPVNDAPAAVADTAATSQGTAVNIDVLANDTDVDGDTLTVTGVTQGAHGTVTFTATGVTYTPAPGYTGTDTFTYTVSDGHGGTTTAAVTVTVHPLGSIGGELWWDDDNDGIHDPGETGGQGMSGVEIWLLDAFDNVVDYQTATSGQILFGGLAPGQYRVFIVLDRDMVFGLQNQGSDDDVDSDFSTAGYSDWITIGFGDEVWNIDGAVA